MKISHFKSLSSYRGLTTVSCLSWPDPAIKSRNDVRGKRCSEQGSIFFYIMVAVVLFASLSYAVSRNNTGSTNIFDEEQAKIAAQEIIEYGNTVVNAVQKLRLRGCKIVADDIQDSPLDVTKMGFNFGNDDNKNVDGTVIRSSADFTSAPSDDSCSVFHINGGNIGTFIHDNPRPFIPSSNVYASGHGAVARKDLIGIGETGLSDLVWSIGDINVDVCIKINELLGVTNPSGNPPVEIAPAILGDEATELAGKTAFCYFRNAATNQRHFFNQALVTF